VSTQHNPNPALDLGPGGDLAIVIAACDGLLDHGIPAARRSAQLNRAARTAWRIWDGLKVAGSMILIGVVALFLLAGRLGLPVAVVVVVGSELVLATLLIFPALARRRRGLRPEEAGDEEQHALFGAVEQINCFSPQFEAWGVKAPHLETRSFVQLERQVRDLRERLSALCGQS